MKFRDRVTSAIGSLVNFMNPSEGTPPPGDEETTSSGVTTSSTQSSAASSNPEEQVQPGNDKDQLSTGKVNLGTQAFVPLGSEYLTRYLNVSGTQPELNVNDYIKMATEGDPLALQAYNLMKWTPGKEDRLTNADYFPKNTQDIIGYTQNFGMSAPIFGGTAARIPFAVIESRKKSMLNAALWAHDNLKGKSTSNTPGYWRMQPQLNRGYLTEVDALMREVSTKGQAGLNQLYDPTSEYGGRLKSINDKYNFLAKESIQLAESAQKMVNDKSMWTPDSIRRLSGDFLYGTGDFADGRIDSDQMARMGRRMYAVPDYMGIVLPKIESTLRNEKDIYEPSDVDVERFAKDHGVKNVPGGREKIIQYLQYEKAIKEGRIDTQVGLVLRNNWSTIQSVYPEADGYDSWSEVLSAKDAYTGENTPAGKMPLKDFLLGSVTNDVMSLFGHEMGIQGRIIGAPANYGGYGKPKKEPNYMEKLSDFYDANVQQMQDIISDARQNIVDQAPTALTTNPTKTDLEFAQMQFRGMLGKYNELKAKTGQRFITENATVPKNMQAPVEWNLFTGVKPKLNNPYQDMTWGEVGEQLRGDLASNHTGAKQNAYEKWYSMTYGIKPPTNGWTTPGAPKIPLDTQLIFKINNLKGAFMDKNSKNGYTFQQLMMLSGLDEQNAIPGVKAELSLVSDKKEIATALKAMGSNINVDVSDNSILSAVIKQLQEKGGGLPTLTIPRYMDFGSEGDRDVLDAMFDAHTTNVYGDQYYNVSNEER